VSFIIRMVGRFSNSNRALIGEPISGALLDQYSYLGLSLFAGLALILGMVILAVARFTINSKLITKV
jgi:hypothetical protein